MDDLTACQDAFASLLAGLSVADYARPSPCPGWSVADVARHVVVGDRAFTTSLGGTAYDLAAIAAACEGLGPAELPAAYAETGESLRTALAGAGPEAFPTGIGPMTAPQIAELRGLEALVHGWDVATATGRTLLVDDALAERALAWAEALIARLPPDRQPFGDPQPVAADAPPLDRLVARLGR